MKDEDAVLKECDEGVVYIHPSSFILHPYKVAAIALAVAALTVAESKVIVLPERGLCAHRGAMDTRPENTVPAFEEAARLGAQMIEFDVCLTKDGALVIMHDPTVDRTTDGKGKVEDLTLAEIKQLDAGRWKDPKFAGVRIPTLKEALDVMPVNVWLNVHLKGGAEVGEKTARVIAEDNRLHQAFLACGVEAANAAKAVAPSILICNMERQGGTREYVEQTIALKANFIQLSVPLGEELADYTKRLRDAGIHINCFGTDSPDILRKWFSAGVEFPLVNKVGDLMKVAEELGMMPVKPVFRSQETGVRSQKRSGNDT